MASTPIRAFLFSDLEGSTALWDAQPDEMSSAVVAHDRLVHEIVAASGGNVFKRTGDGFCAVFGDPASAITAATNLQRRLAEADCTVAGRRLGARMAVHVGAAESRDGDFFGPTLNRCARVMACGHGGQILATDAAVSVLDRSALADVTFADLGSHKLRGLDRAERIHQVVASGLACEFPPLRSEQDAARLRLPNQRSRFLGRRAEVEQVVGLTDRERLVTLSGVGGCGKTRLAVEVARRVGVGLSDGACFVDLVSVREDELVGDAVANALSVPLEQDRPAIGQVAQLLAAKELLLVLDNCEHVLEAAAGLAESILDGCPDVTVLATSREPLGIDGEHVFRVGSLGLPVPGDDPSTTEAVLFFAERATAAKATFDLEAHLAAVVDICRRLDGVPLALELAAARVRYETPEQLSAQLDDRFRLLAGGPRRLARQQTLQATMDWSYALLRPSEQSAFRRLGVFIGTFSREAFEDICAGGVGEHEVLESLIDKSLVEVVEHAGRTRFRALETVRIYAIEKLMAEGELAEARRRHRDFFVALCRRWETEGGDAFFSADLSASEMDNLTAALFEADEAEDHEALAHLVEVLGPVWMLLTRQEEGRRWIDRLRAEDHGLSLARRTGWRAASISLDWAAAEAGVGLADAIQALELDPAGDTNGAVVAGFFRAGMTAYFDCEEALEHYRAIRAMRALTSRPDILAAISYAEGVTHMIGGSLDEAEARFRGALVAHRGNTYSETWDRVGLATMLHLAGRHAEAVAEARTAVDGLVEDALYMQDLLAPAVLGVAFAGLGDVAGAVGQLQRTLDVLDRRYAHMPRVVGVPATVAVWIGLASREIRSAAELIAATEAHFLNYRTEFTFAMLAAAHRDTKAALGDTAWREARAQGRTWSPDRHMAEVRKAAASLQ